MVGGNVTSHDKEFAFLTKAKDDFQESESSLPISPNVGESFEDIDFVPILSNSPVFMFLSQVQPLAMSNRQSQKLTLQTEMFQVMLILAQMPLSMTHVHLKFSVIDSETINNPFFSILEKRITSVQQLVSSLLRIRITTFIQAPKDVTWMEATEKELAALEGNGTWVISDLSQNKIVIYCK